MENARAYGRLEELKLITPCSRESSGGSARDILWWIKVAAALEPVGRLALTQPLSSVSPARLLYIIGQRRSDVEHKSNGASGRNIHPLFSPFFPFLPRPRAVHLFGTSRVKSTHIFNVSWCRRGIRRVLSLVTINSHKAFYTKSSSWLPKMFHGTP